MLKVSLTFLLVLAALSKAGRVKRAQFDQVTFINKLLNTPFVISEQMNKFNHDLFEAFAESNDGNIVYSPFSLHAALGMVLIGAPNESKTYQELAEALYGSQTYNTDYLFNYFKILNFYNSQNSDTKIKIANRYCFTSFLICSQLIFPNFFRAYADQSLALKANYSEYLQTFFRTTLSRVDFSESADVAREINNFVEDTTDGLIKEVAQEQDFNELTKLVLINAMYFKAKWLHPFNQARTNPMKFKIREELEVEYPFGMFLKANLQMADLTDDGFGARILELPYENENFRMLLILPNEKIEDLDLDKLDYDKMDRKMVSASTNVILPRFTIEFEAAVKDTLLKMGIEEVFVPGSANLKDISNDELHVEKIQHKAKIEVNEEGSEAAAVTTVQINTRSGSIRDRRVVFNKPFYFMIQDSQHKVPLFMGRITDPTGRHGLGTKQVSLDEILDAEDCDELGFTTDEDNSGKIALPCKGRNTFPVRDNGGFQ